MSNVIDFPPRPVSSDGLSVNGHRGSFESAIRNSLRAARARYGGGADLDAERVKYACLVQEAMHCDIQMRGRIVLPGTLETAEVDAIRLEIDALVPQVVDAVFQHCTEVLAQAVVVLSCPNMMDAEIETLESGGDYGE